MAAPTLAWFVRDALVLSGIQPKPRDEPRGVARDHVSAWWWRAQCLSNLWWRLGYDTQESVLKEWMRNVAAKVDFVKLARLAPKVEG